MQNEVLKTERATDKQGRRGDGCPNTLPRFSLPVLSHNMVLESCYSKCDPEASASFGNLLEMQPLGTHPRPTELESAF